MAGLLESGEGLQAGAGPTSNSGRGGAPGPSSGAAVLTARALYEEAAAAGAHSGGAAGGGAHSSGGGAAGGDRPPPAPSSSFSFTSGTGSSIADADDLASLSNM